MRRIAAGLAAASFIMAAQAATAAGPYDGTWVVDVPAAGFNSTTSNYACPALRLPIQIESSRVVGSLERVSTTTGAVIVQAGNDRAATPVSGSVAPDGTVRAQWENYSANGRLGPQMGRVTIKGECGPRTATAVRITSAAATSSAGSSVEPLQGR